ncbi:hypothetical protein ACFSBZ_00240 [Amnibacterium flavum]|uniref:Uridine kinase n=1 Tax=Amnibacterium flavum TaxID=2173173 RepID=A0A2V1HLW8_9MICO|nr:hypothetical protein [Amnibacterium flavum]PVZ93636.1 hypothetical protein DDQ50_15145 [Amnibacterium flavum]
MARWAAARADVIGEFADEILHNYRGGRAVVGVDGVPGAGQAAFADELASALRERGETAYRATADADDDPTAAAVRADAIEPFRAGRPPFDDQGSAILVVDGTRLHSEQLLSAFAYTIWLALPESAETGPRDLSDEQARYERQRAPRVRATSNVDNTDPEHPRRTFADSC